MRRIVGIVILGLAYAIASPAARATAQSGDVLIVGGQEHSIQTNPLEDLFETKPSLRPKSEVISTSLWRGYIATWQLSDGKLCLIDVEIKRRKPDVEKFEAELHSVMFEMFPQQSCVLADWYTGYVIVPHGDLVEYVHTGYASTFEQYTVYTMVRGTQTKERRMNRKQFRRFRKSQFRAYKKTDKYAFEFSKFKDDDESVAEVESFLSKCRASTICRSCSMALIDGAVE